MRRPVDALEPIHFARLRTGGQLHVVDASGYGALIETRERLLPGRHLDIHLVAAAGRVLVRARVTRAYVCRLQADAVDYRAALAFDQAVDTRPPGYAIPVVGQTVADDEGIGYPRDPRGGEIEFTEQPSA